MGRSKEWTGTLEIEPTSKGTNEDENNKVKMTCHWISDVDRHQYGEQRLLDVFGLGSDTRISYQNTLEEERRFSSKDLLRKRDAWRKTRNASDSGGRGPAMHLSSTTACTARPFTTHVVKVRDESKDMEESGRGKKEEDGKEGHATVK